MRLRRVGDERNENVPTGWGSVGLEMVCAELLLAMSLP